jgi:hypothetical protein
MIHNGIELVMHVIQDKIEVVIGVAKSVSSQLVCNIHIINLSQA